MASGQPTGSLTPISRPPAGSVLTPSLNKSTSESRNAVRAAQRRRKKIRDKIISSQVLSLVPESKAYNDLLLLENKLDMFILRKRLEIQEALKRPSRVKQRLKILLTTNYLAPSPERPGEYVENLQSPTHWELRVEGRLDDDVVAPTGVPVDPLRPRRKFSTFFQTLVIELDKELYGPDNHLVQWARTPTTQETDGFQVKKPLYPDRDVHCLVVLKLDHQPPKYKLAPMLARVLGIQTSTRAEIVTAFWQYIRRNNLQDPHHRDSVRANPPLQAVLGCETFKFTELPRLLNTLILPCDPIVIHTVISGSPSTMIDSKRSSAYEVDIEVDDKVRDSMHAFFMSTNGSQELQNLENKICELVDNINQAKTSRQFYLSFAESPHKFINNWLISQSRDLHCINDGNSRSEEERRSDFYNQPWAEEAVHRYIYRQMQQRRTELEHALNLRSSN